MAVDFPVGTRVRYRHDPSRFGVVTGYPAFPANLGKYRYVRWDGTGELVFAQIRFLLPIPVRTSVSHRVPGTTRST